MQNNKTFWVGAVLVIVVIMLAFWWVSSGLPLSTWIGSIGRSATSTPQTSENNTGSGSQTGSTPRGEQDVASIVASLQGVSTFKSLFVSTGVAATINPQSVSDYTIFVPTDGAVSQLTPGTITGLSAAEKKRLVQYHVISGRAVDVEAVSAGQIQALSGDMLNFTFDEDGIPMVGSAIVVATYQGTNGTVYVIDNVLLPPTRTN